MNSLKILFLTTLLFTSCTTVTLRITENEGDYLTMTSIKEHTFSCTPKEKLKIIFSPKDGGKIDSIFWEGKLIASNFSESYPNPENDFKTLNNRILNDGAGLIIVDSQLKNFYQLRRSYSLVYNEELKQHYLEVIYNVKNLSEEAILPQQWLQTLSVTDTQQISLSSTQLSAIYPKTTFTIFPINLVNAKFTRDGDNFTLGNNQTIDLPFKERLSWKILYIFND